MRNTDQQLKDIIDRSEAIKKRHADNQKTALYSLSVGFVLVLMVMTGIFAPSVLANAVETQSVHYGSLILSAGHMGYLIIAVLAFILGILVTLFCFHLNQIKKREENR